MKACPNCGSVKSWHFSRGEMNAPEDRFDKASPDTGDCTKCGFAYTEHVQYPIKQQIARFRREGELAQ